MSNPFPSPENLLQYSKASVNGIVNGFYKHKFTVEEAKDLIQDVVYKALRNASRFNPDKGTYSTWVKTIALNTVRTALRSKAARRMHLVSYDGWEARPDVVLWHESAPDASIREHQAREQIHSKAYSGRDHIILRMREAGYDSGEIAQELSTTPGCVYVALHRVKTRINLAA